MHTAPPLHMPRHPCLLGNKPPGGLACTRFIFTNSIDYRLLAALKLNYELITELVLLYLWFKEAYFLAMYPSSRYQSAADRTLKPVYMSTTLQCADNDWH